MLGYEISPTEAAQILREKGVRLVDVREPWEFATTLIEGSLPIPMGEVATRAHKELDIDERLVIVCHHGVRCAAASTPGRSKSIPAWRATEAAVNASPGLAGLYSHLSDS
jgi:rhodanese-related sulfurtransferase